MHPYEEATIRVFICPPRRTRWLEALSSAKRRRRFLDHLNHCQDFDDRYSTPFSSASDVVSVLRSVGAEATCYVTSDLAHIDGREMDLSEAVAQAELGGFGTLITCVPGRLAYYYDEAGSRRRLLLERRDA